MQRGAPRNAYVGGVGGAAGAGAGAGAAAFHPSYAQPGTAAAAGAYRAVPAAQPQQQRFVQPPRPAPVARRLMTAKEWFMHIDRTRCGQINAQQLSHALSQMFNKFSLATTSMVIRMFDHKGTKTLTLPEFEQLCTYINAWRDMFNKTDSNRSGSLSFQEVSGLLQRMGYRLSSTSLARVWLVYDDDKSGSLGFDEFIMLLAELKMTTAAFARVDTARAGRVTLDFNSYLRLMMQTKVL